VKARKTPATIDIAALCSNGIKATRAALNSTLKYADYYPEEAFRETEIDGKKALVVDALAEAQFKVALGDRCYYVEAVGEESLGKKVPPDKALDLRGKEGIHALVDMIDGTDLLERGLSNWCSAGCFFEPRGNPGSQILASFVRVTSGEFYYSTSAMEDVMIKPTPRRDPVAVAGCSSVTSLENASVCFYGQKAENLCSIFGEPNENNVAANSLLQYVIEHDLSKFRIYNLAGIPMILKMIDHKVKAASNIDAVFDLRGQQPHDVIPAAYLALKAKATVRKLWVDGSSREPKSADMTLEDLEESLMRPTLSRLKYIISSTKELADEMTPLLLPLLRKKQTSAQ
jgi:hypothetical protein